MHLLRPLLATLAISLTLPLSAAPEEVHVDTEPYEVLAGDTKNFGSTPILVDKEVFDGV